MAKVTYTTILHQAREDLSLTTNEYCVADIIYHLSNNPKSKVQGWCFASKQTIGGFIGITKQSALTIIEKLITKEIIERDEETKYLKTTKKWYEIVILGQLKIIGKESIPVVKKTAEVVKKTATVGSKLDSLYYSNSYNNNILKNKKVFSFTEKMEILKKSEKKIDKIISLYWISKSWIFENYNQYQTAYKRDMMLAHPLVGYSGQQLSKVMKHCQDTFEDNWSLSAVAKQAPNIINKKI